MALGYLNSRDFHTMPLGLFSCSCRNRNRSTKEPAKTKAKEPQKASSPDDDGKEPLMEKPKARKEDRVCPLTGAIGYCPMAKPPKGTKLPDVKPELRVMMFLLWEEDEDKVSVGVYPHMSQHWEVLELPDTSTKEEIKQKFHKLSIKYHPDKNSEDGAAERFKKISEAYQALREVDGGLAFPWDKYPERQHIMRGAEVLATFGVLASEAAQTDPIKAQMMQHVVKESTECKVLKHERETNIDGFRKKETWADALCIDERNGSNHLVKVYRRIISLDD